MDSSCIPSRGEESRQPTETGDNLRPDGPLGSYADFTFTLQFDTAVKHKHARTSISHLFRHCTEILALVVFQFL